jgi:hypothetical protein
MLLIEIISSYTHLQQGGKARKPPVTINVSHWNVTAVTLCTEHFILYVWLSSLLYHTHFEAVNKDVERFVNLPGTSHRDRWPLLVSSLPAPPPSTSSSSSIRQHRQEQATAEWAVLALHDNSFKHASSPIRETETEATQKEDSKRSFGVA